MNRAKNMIIIICAMVLSCIILEVTNIGCPIKFITGISCAGCGMTRAWLSLIQLNFNDAFHFHPLFWLPPIAVLIFIFKSKIPKNLYCIAIGITCILFLAVYGYRMIFENDNIVVFAPQNSFICKIIKYLL